MRNKNQGGIAILQEAICIAGNTIDREPQNGGNGLGCQPDVAYTLTATDHHAVFGQSQFGNYAEGCTTLRAQGGDNGGGSENLVATSAPDTRNLIRRLTPLECERLQGFPDGWTLIPGCSDSARYKALGNSVAIPCVTFIMRGIAIFYPKSRANPFHIQKKKQNRSRKNLSLTWSILRPIPSNPCWCW